MRVERVKQAPPLCADIILCVDDIESQLCITVEVVWSVDVDSSDPKGQLLFEIRQPMTTTMIS